MQAGTKTPEKTGNGERKPVMMRPFRVGVQDVDDDPYDVTRTLTAAAQTLPQYEIPSTGYLNDVYVLVEATGSVRGAATVAYTEDAPFRALENFTFTDTNSAEVVGPITGWDLAVIDKFGGYAFEDDPRASTVYSAVDGTDAAAGDFSFVLRIPNELVRRDALGSLPNKSASTPYKVKLTLAASGDVYATPPATTLPDVRVRMMPFSYWEPQKADASGNPIAPEPPGVNTTQYWNKTTYTVSAGFVSPLLNNSVGFPVRNLVFALRDTAGSRSQGETDFPDPFRLQLQSNTMLNRARALWRHFITEMYGYSGVGDGVGQKDNGVYVIPYCWDFGHKPGWETRRGYLRTTDGSRLQMKGNIGGTGEHQLTVLTNYVGVGAGTTLAALVS